MLHKSNSVDTSFFGWAVALGALIGLGQLLDSHEKLSWRAVAGRAILSAALASIAPVALIWLPALPRTAEFALAAGLASLGTSGAQALVRRLLLGKSS
jgi:hypothetical protein